MGIYTSVVPAKAGTHREMDTSHGWPLRLRLARNFASLVFPPSRERQKRDLRRYQCSEREGVIDRNLSYLTKLRFDGRADQFANAGEIQRSHLRIKPLCILACHQQRPKR